MGRNRNKSMDTTRVKDPSVKYSYSKMNKYQEMSISGFAGGNISEGFPQLITTDSEEVFGQTSNANIVIGRDRPSHMGSGYGGLGHTGASSIDIVVGRPGTAEEHVNPNFSHDAARIHISQKTDIDSNFGICEGDIGSSHQRSGVAVKADAVRVIGREGVKIISGGDSTNSQGGSIETFSGIEIIANNDDSDLQPIPKGNNLVMAIEELSALVYDLSGLLNSFAIQQDAFNAVTMTHFHYSPFYGIPTCPSETLMDQGLQTLQNHFQDVEMGLLDFTKNLALFMDTYTRPHGKNYINSKFNKVN